MHFVVHHKLCGALTVRHDKLPCARMARSKIMTTGPVEPFKIENESEADAYLKDLFERPEYRSMDEAHIRAQELIEDPSLKIYFINEARERLKAYDTE
jgi:hypothetical protein